MFKPIYGKVSRKMAACVNKAYYLDNMSFEEPSAHSGMFSRIDARVNGNSDIAYELMNQVNAFTQHASAVSDWLVVAPGLPDWPAVFRLHHIS